MPFCGSPVFPIAPRSSKCLCTKSRSSPRLCLPFKALAFESAAHSFEAYPSSRSETTLEPAPRSPRLPKKSRKVGYPPERSVALQRLRRVLVPLRSPGARWILPSSTEEPVRSVSTLSTSRATWLSALISRVYFTPVTLLSFCLQGFQPPGDRVVSPPLILPCRWASRSGDARGFEGSVPPGSQIAQFTRRDPCPLGIRPSEALPFTTVESASRPILSRA
jgi:hypothetical protein